MASDDYDHGGPDDDDAPPVLGLVAAAAAAGHRARRDDHAAQAVYGGLYEVYMHRGAARSWSAAATRRSCPPRATRTTPRSGTNSR